MPRPTLWCLLAWLGMQGLAAAQTDPAPLTPPGYGDPSDPLPLPPQNVPPQPGPPQPLPHYHGLPPQPVTLPPADGPWQYVPPTPDALPAPAASAVGGSSDEQSQHLLKAAEHLEAAGLTEQAARLRQEARQRSLAPLLAAKLAQLKTLQAEVEQLKQAAGGERYVTLKLKIAEVSRSKVRESVHFIDPQSTVGSLLHFERIDGRPAAPIVLQTEDFRRDWSALEEAGAVCVLSSPSVATPSGQSAKCLVGELRPTSVPAGKDQTAIDLKHLGVSVEVMPQVLDDNRLRLELRCSASTPDSSRDRRIGGRIVPGMRAHEIDIEVELRVGQTAVLACIDEDDKRAADVRQTSTNERKEDKDDNVTLIFVTPTEIGEKIERVAPPSPVAEKPATSWWERWWRK